MTHNKMCSATNVQSEAARHSLPTNPWASVEQRLMRIDLWAFRTHSGVWCPLREDCCCCSGISPSVFIGSSVIKLLEDPKGHRKISLSASWDYVEFVARLVQACGGKILINRRIRKTHSDHLLRYFTSFPLILIKIMPFLDNFFFLKCNFLQHNVFGAAVVHQKCVWFGGGTVGTDPITHIWEFSVHMLPH